MQNLDTIRRIVSDTLNSHLFMQGLRSIQVTEDRDCDGDEALYIDANFDLIDSPLEPTRFHFLTTELRQALIKGGEYRFPHLRYQFHEKQKVKGWQ